MTPAHLQAVHPVLSVRDHVGIRRDHVELHLQWHDASECDHPVDRPTYRFAVDDVDALHAEFSALGRPLEITPVSDKPWGTRAFHLRDPDGNGLQFYRDLD